MEVQRRSELIKRRAVAKASLTRMQGYINSGDELKFNEVKVRFEALPSIFNKFDAVQELLEIEDDTDHSSERQQFECQYYEVKAKFNELLHPVLDPLPSKHSQFSPRFGNSPRSQLDAPQSGHQSSSSNNSKQSNASPRSGNSSRIKLPTLQIPTFSGETCLWLSFRDTFEALIVNNKTLLNVQKFHYLISSLKDEARNLIANLQITNENFFVAWNLITQRYNNKRLIAMMHAKHLCKLPEVKRANAASMRQFINHVASHMNALQALALTTSTQDLMLNTLMLASLDQDTQKEFEIFTSSRIEPPTTAELISFLETRCRVLELLQHTQSLPSTPVTTRQSTRLANALTHKVGRNNLHCNVATQLQCTLCRDTHKLFKCDKFLKLQCKQRVDHVKRSNLCFNCLQENKRNHACSNQTCKTCNRRHHTLLHFELPEQSRDKVATSSQQAEETNSYCNFKGKPQTQVLLATAIVEVKDKDGKFIPCRCLLDGGSQTSFISSQCVQRLKLPKKQSHTLIQGINAVSTATHHNVQVHLRSMHTHWKSTINCAVLTHITGLTPASKLDINNWKIPTDIKLADQAFNIPGTIDILLGAETFYDVLRSGRRTKEGNFPVLQETTLGWIISGKTPQPTQSGPQQVLFVQPIDTLETHLDRFWEVESMEQPTMTAEQKACEEHFTTNTTRQEDGRFVVRLPTKLDPHHLGSSRFAAEQRLHHLERKLELNPELKLQYHDFMKEYEELGHMEQVTSQDNPGPCYFLPHHAVFKESSTTTKTRVVFDGGARTSNGISLNDILQVGATVQPDLYSIVLRFRIHQVCFTADIAKMYRQILVHPQDRDLQRILWRYSSDQPVREYKLNTITYGISSAPFLATRCLKKLADDNSEQFPTASQVINNEFYVDDLLSGTSTVQEAVQIQQELTTLLQTAGLTLRKWASNSPRFLETIPEELKETKQTLSLDSQDGITTLGLQWNPHTDQFQVKSGITPEYAASVTANTKRKVLATTASIFDPLGLLSPSVIIYKIFLQQLWQDKLSWDIQLPHYLQQRWNHLQQTIPQLSQIRINRKVIQANATRVQIHGFCDSSELAYGACLYIRSTSANQSTSCDLLCSTSRVAPLKKLTIPRLELCAATLLAKLYRKAISALNMTVNETYLWTDSSIVLTWIQGPPTKWKTFIGNRVALIQEKTASATWRHVPTQSNPADLISRGIEPNTLSTCNLWWKGPHWILQEPTSWPSFTLNNPTGDLELKRVYATLLPEDITARFSNFNKLVRVVAYCRRFINNCRHPPAERQHDLFSTHDLHQAKMCCVKMVQQAAFFPEIQDLTNQREVAATSSLKTLHPFIDKEGLLRVGGRLQNAALPYDAKHQLILPPCHHVTRLIALAEHIRLKHAGSQQLIASLHETYWIPRIKVVIKRIIYQCLTCFRFKAKATEQLMGQLPSPRVQPSRPFQIVGTDYAGPIQLRVGLNRSKTIVKGYIALFVCFATKAVHIEVVTSLTTESFLAALRRFISRRGIPRIIYSDNGTNFQGAAHQLHDVYKMFQSSSTMNKLQYFLTESGCEWKFIPPRSPHFGGLWEAAVKSMKHHLRRTLGSHIATYEELCTLLTEIEACLNSRPLMVNSEDPFNPSYLSPGHFLTGQPITQIPSVDYTNVKSNTLSRWQLHQRMLQQFWKLWSSDYLQQLQTRRRWQHTNTNVQPGSLVLLREDNTGPLHWPVAVISAVHPGRDGKVRVVTLKTPQGTFTRPLTKICFLPLPSND